MIKPKYRHRRFRRIPFLLVFCLIASVISGEESKKAEEPENTINAAINMGLDVSQGNTKAFGINAGINVGMVFNQKTEIVFTSTVNYLETDGEKKADKMDCTILFDQVLARGVTMFLLAKPSKNTAQAIDFRLETGGGFKFDLINNSHRKKEEDFLFTDLSLSWAVLYELTNRLSLEKEKLSRLSIRPRYKQRLARNLELWTTLFYQPKLGTIKDFRLLLDAEFRFKISASISYLFKLLGEYNSVVPAGIGKTDYQLINQLSITM